MYAKGGSDQESAWGRLREVPAGRVGDLQGGKSRRIGYWRVGWGICSAASPDGSSEVEEGNTRVHE